MAEKLIKVEKDGEMIEISPLTLENHKQLGWKVVEAEPDGVSTETPEKPASKRAKK
jgi:hypothetical protein